MESCYINLKIVDDNFELVKNYAQMSAEFCKRHEHQFWANYTGCLSSIRQTDRPIKEVNELRLLLRQLTRNDDDLTYTREKHGLFNFIGWICKILFGSMDSEDANYYTDKISHLENEQLDFLKLSKEQMTVVKTTLTSINSTLLTVTENEKSPSKGLEEMVKHVNEQDGEIKEMFTAYSLLTINEHAMQLNTAIDECRREYEILIDAMQSLIHKRVLFCRSLSHLRRYWSR